MNLEPYYADILIVTAVSIVGLIFLAYRIGRRPTQVEQNIATAHEWLIDILRKHIDELTTQRDTAIEVAKTWETEVQKLTDHIVVMGDDVASYSCEMAEEDEERERVRGVQRIRDARRRLRKSP